MIVASNSLSFAKTQDGRSTVDLSEADLRCDALDDFNHTRFRRARILEALMEKENASDEAGIESTAAATPISIHLAQRAESLEFYEPVHTPGLLDFLVTAYEAWKSLGLEGWDSIGCMDGTEPTEECSPPPLIHHNMPLPRLANNLQRPSKHVLGQMGYYCNDTCTPIFDQLSRELLDDAGIMQQALELALTTPTSTIYAVPTHPGHHSAQDSFGGYCYLNHVAALAKQLQQKLGGDAKVAILDVDYHCGNGTASIFDSDPSVLVVSLHCDPNVEYPFHMGFADQEDDHEDCPAYKTLHLPLPPKTTWRDYKGALEKGLSRIFDKFQPVALVVSLGLDTYTQDPCALRRAGFDLQGDDYVEMGRLIGEYSKDLSSVIVMQEGGYRMDAVPQAAVDVVTSCHAARTN